MTAPSSIGPAQFLHEHLTHASEGPAPGDAHDLRQHLALCRGRHRVRGRLLPAGVSTRRMNNSWAAWESPGCLAPRSRPWPPGQPERSTSEGCPLMTWVAQWVRSATNPTAASAPGLSRSRWPIVSWWTRRSSPTCSRPESRYPRTSATFRDDRQFWAHLNQQIAQHASPAPHPSEIAPILQRTMEKLYVGR